MKYYYFISFQCENSLGFARGNMCFDSPMKIRTANDINAIRQHIEEKENVSKVTITNVVLLDSE